MRIHVEGVKQTRLDRMPEVGDEFSDYRAKCYVVTSVMLTNKQVTPTTVNVATVYMKRPKGKKSYFAFVKARTDRQGALSMTSIMEGVDFSNEPDKASTSEPAEDIT